MTMVQEVIRLKDAADRWRDFKSYLVNKQLSISEFQVLVYGSSPRGDPLGHSQVYAIANGNKAIAEELLTRWAQALDVPPDELRQFFPADAPISVPKKRKRASTPVPNPFVPNQTFTLTGNPDGTVNLKITLDHTPLATALRLIVALNSLEDASDAF